VNNEDDFTELLCNMMKYEDFQNIFSEFFGIKTSEKKIDTQYITKKNGKPDLVISYDNGIEFIEAKVGDSRLTKNQPEGYIRELGNRLEKTKKLYFIIPKNYYFKKDLEKRKENVKNKNIPIDIKYWESFFEHCKRNINIFNKNKILFEYYNLLKSWFGYETVIFNKKEQKIMKENGKVMYKVGKWLESISSLLEQNGYTVDRSDGLQEIGIYIYNKSGVFYGWIGVWFPVWKKYGHCFIYTISNKVRKRYYNNFINIYKNCHEYVEDIDDKPEGKAVYKYICFDDHIFNKENDESVVFKELSDILKSIKK
jgi:hypothetical protein